MTRYLTVLGLVLAAAAAFTALSTSLAGAVSEETLQSYFMAELEEEEIGKIDGEQIGTNTITIGSLPAATCSSVKYNGEAVTEGPVSTQVEITPVYETCHVITPLLGTRTITVTMNGCAFEIEATATVTESGEEHQLDDLDIVCPAGKAIELHVYNTSSASDTGASTLCTFNIEPQLNLPGITATNKRNEPSAVNDIGAHFNISSIKVVRTGGTEAFCGPTSQTAVYKGEATLRVTNEASEFVSVLQLRKKEFFFGGKDKSLTVKGTGGKAKFTTEKGPIECSSVEYEGSPSAGRDDLTIKPKYPDCKFDGLVADVEFNGCTYTIKLYEGFVNTGKGTRHTTGPMEIKCDTGKAIKVKVTKKGTTEVECTFTFAEQAPEGVVKMKNIKAAPPYVTFTNALTGVVYQVEGNETTCGKNNASILNGALDGEINVKGYFENNQVEFRVEGLTSTLKCPEEK